MLTWLKYSIVGVLFFTCYYSAYRETAGLTGQRLEFVRNFYTETKWMCSFDSVVLQNSHSFSATAHVTCRCAAKLRCLF